MRIILFIKLEKRNIGEILKHTYKVNSFGTKDSKISQFILELSNEDKISFLISALVDKGSVAYDGSVIFGVMNKELAEKVNYISENLGIVTNGIKQKKNTDFYYFYIKDIEKLKKEAEKIQKKYPYVLLRHKLEILSKVFEIRKRKYEYTPGFADKRIRKVITLIKEKDMKINELSHILLIPPRTLRRYMYSLIKESKIVRRLDGREYIYSLVN